MGVFSAALFAGLIAVVPQIWIANSSLEKTLIHSLKPVTIKEQILGNYIPERFYVINGKKAYIEIDGEPVEEYLRSTNYDISR